MSENRSLATTLHRRLRAIAAILRDPAATEHEKANAASLKKRLEGKLQPESRPETAWTVLMFRLGRTARTMRQSSSSSSPRNNWEDRAFRLGRALRQLKRKR
jgi:hypothetical protein